MYLIYSSRFLYMNVLIRKVKTDTDLKNKICFDGFTESFLTKMDTWDESGFLGHNHHRLV